MFDDEEKRPNHKKIILIILAVLAVAMVGMFVVAKITGLKPHTYKMSTSKAYMAATK